MKPGYAMQSLLVCIITWGFASCLESAPLNIGGVVRDSVSHDSLPLVKVTITDLGKSFTTKRSSFYIALEQGEYTLLFEAEDYELLQSTINISTEGDEFLFEMVKVSDRIELDKRNDSLYLYMLGFTRAIRDLNLDNAHAYMMACQRFNATNSQMDSMALEYETVRVLWVDSVFLHAQVLEDSQKISDAFYYYKKILAVDSLHEGAQQGAAKTEKILTTKIDGNTKPISGTSSGSGGSSSNMTSEQIESIFNQGVSRFIAEDYEGALVLFQTVLKHNPNHDGGRTYLSRTQSRLQAINK